MKKIAFVLAASTFLLFGTAHAVEANTTRKSIEIVSPIMLNALQSIENAQGVVFADKELRSVLQSPEFSRQYVIELRKFCDSPDNARTMVCTDRGPALSAAALSNNTN